MAEINPTDERSVLDKVRRILLAILALGMAGSLTELILLKHTEDLIQWVPLVLLGAGGAVLACCWRLHSISAWNRRGVLG